MKRLACLLVLLFVATVRAQTAAPPPPVAAPMPVGPMPTPAAPEADAPSAEPPSLDDGSLHPTKADRATCLLLDTTPGALIEPTTTSDHLATPIPWNDFSVDGRFISGDSKETLRAIFEPTLNEHRTNFTTATWKTMAALAARFGYQLVGHVVANLQQGPRLVMSVAPLPLVRRVYTSVDSHSPFLGLFDRLLDDEVGRRLRVRPGSYLPWEPIRRQCAMADERDRIESYLHDEGYADATVQIDTAFENAATVQIRIHVDLGKEKYIVGLVRVVNATPQEPLAISVADIRKTFEHKADFHLTTASFTRSQLQEDLQSVRDMFHKRGYPMVRVTSSFDPKISFDRRTHTVNFTVTIDPRRFVEIKFEGNNTGSVSDDDLRRQLTFDAAGSIDDVEAQTSATAIAAFLQARGYFDARVTFDHLRLTGFDRITFQLDPGPSREVTSVTFVGANVIPTTKLYETIGTKESGLRGSIFGTNTAATSAQLALDVQNVTDLYRHAGYRDAKVSVTAATTPAGLDNAALAAALMLAQRGGDLYVRFTIDEGRATQLSRIALEIQAEPKQQAQLCTLALAELASELGEPQFAKRDTSMGDACAATASNFAFRDSDVAATRDRLRDYLYSLGRSRAVVEYEAKPLGPLRVSAQYKVRATEELRIGKVVIRGNFKTRESIIRRQLGLKEGALLTSDALANGARQLRNTGLFDAVNIELPDLCGPQATQATCTSGSSVVNGVVRVEERYDQSATVDLIGGYSSYNGAFAGAEFAMHNLGGLGLVWTVNATIGTKITDLETAFQIPKWLVPEWSPFAFRTDITGLYRQQDTPRFGVLTTEGASLALTQQWSRQRSGKTPARVLTLNLPRYDFRKRTREVDALRPIGTNQDESQVAVSTRTSSVGITFDWEQRTDRKGNLNPLSPEDGFRFEASAAYAESFLLGQDTFVKLSTTGSKFVSIGDNLVLRGDLRGDWGIPLGGAVLLPEVERFFAGGDSTVRGYSDDRMATELIHVGLPPLGSNISQIRIIPAGGNIRVIGSLDAQQRIWKVFAGALFGDAGMISNTWGSVTSNDIRPSVGMGLRAITPFGIGALEYAVPLRPQLGDDPRGRLHFYFAARAQF
ncbi:MAG: POTRA domain-containing protein [Deltaproteobacteria bacterium]